MPGPAEMLKHRHWEGRPLECLRYQSQERHGEPVGMNQSSIPILNGDIGSVELTITKHRDQVLTATPSVSVGFDAVSGRS